MERDLEFIQQSLALREDVIIKEHKAVVHNGSGLAQGLAEIDLAAAICGQVFNQQGTGPACHFAFDLGIAAKALGLFAHVLHGQHQTVGNPSGKGDAGGFSAGHIVDGFIAYFAPDGCRCKIDQGRTQAGVGNYFAAVNIHRAGPAGGEKKGLFLVKVNSLDFKQHFCRLIGDHRLVARDGKSNHAVLLA